MHGSDHEEVKEEYCDSPLDGMLVHRRVIPQQYVAGTHLYSLIKRDKVEYSSLSKETTRWARLDINITNNRVKCKILTQ